jgi:hypothetical protein
MRAFDSIPKLTGAYCDPRGMREVRVYIDGMTEAEIDDLLRGAMPVGTEWRIE